MIAGFTRFNYLRSFLFVLREEHGESHLISAFNDLGFAVKKLTMLGAVLQP